MPRLANRRVLRPPQVRGVNRAVVLQLLRNNDSLSRADLARRSGLSEGAVSRIVAGLMEDRLVNEDGAENSTGGRPGRRLELEPSRVSCGAEIQNWETRCVVTTMRGQIVETSRFNTPSNPKAALDYIAEVFRAYRKKFGQDRMEGAGICVRGIVNGETGVLEYGNRPEWVDVPIRRIMEAKLDAPVFVENNVRAAAIAEYHYGSAEVSGGHCFLLVKVDEGIGVGILLDGKVYHGPHMAAGEFGQMVIAAAAGGGERHDRPGCLERMASNPAICDRYRTRTGANRPAGTGDTLARVRRIAHWAISGDADARATLEETARYLGIGISNVVWGLDADVVVIEGAITEAWPIVEPVLRAQFPDRRDIVNFHDLLIRPSALGEEAALIGAAALPFASVFATGVRAGAAQAGTVQ